jgi:BirA family biotin operon repressor/biotin-[acetyl-CoA-carboxylase] ligase
VIFLLSSIVDDFLLGGDFVSGEEMARKAGISRTAVFKRISAMRTAGYVIEASKGLGYKLVPRFDGLLPLEIRMRSRSKQFGASIVAMDCVDSTQNHLRGLALSGAPEGTVVVALEQASGKGRMGRSWSSPRGGLWFSLLLRPSLQPRDLPKLTLLFGVAIAEAVEDLRVKVCLKWPNDLLVGGKKVCGILMETSGEPDRVEYVLVGVGINANFSIMSLPEEVRSKSTTLSEALGKNVDRCGLIARILELSEGLYSEAQGEGFDNILNAWRSRSCTTGRDVTVISFGNILKGTAVDIDEDGSLLLETESGRVRVYSGDVIL